MNSNEEMNERIRENRGGGDDGMGDTVERRIGRWEQGNPAHPAGGPVSPNPTQAPLGPPAIMGRQGQWAGGDSGPSGTVGRIPPSPPAHASPPAHDDIPNVNLDLSEFEVARTEFFSDIHEPAFVFNDGKIGVNTACIRRLPDVEFVQILINRQKQKLAIRACREEDLFSIPWGRTKDGKRFPRQITGKMFFLKVCDMMHWNPMHRYRILGKLVRANGELIFLFDLTAKKTFERTVNEDGKRKTSRNAVFPPEWKNQFGVPFSEHEKALQVNLFDGYTVLSIGEEKKADGETGGDRGSSAMVDRRIGPLGTGQTGPLAFTAQRPVCPVPAGPSGHSGLDSDGPSGQD